MRCPAETALTADETCRLDALPYTHFELDEMPYQCDFGEHGTEVRHTALAQMQHYEPGGLVLWWVLWDDEGHQEVRLWPGCDQPVAEETCLLIKGHPGACDQDIF
jgi:hypothetical protein